MNMKKKVAFVASNNKPRKIFVKRLNKFCSRFDIIHIPHHSTKVFRLWNFDIINFCYMSNFMCLASTINKIRGAKIVAEWIGSDVLNLKSRRKNRIIYKLFGKVDKHICSSPILKKELSNLGINAEFIPIVPPKIPELTPLPDKFRVLMYIPDDRKNFYGKELLLELAKKFPEVEFIIVGGSTNFGFKNIKSLGWVDNMDELYRKTSVLLRFVPHDGFSLMVQEALLHGRHVIYNIYDIPGVCFVKTKEEVINKIKELQQNADINTIGRRYIIKNYSMEKVAEKFKKVYDGLL